MKLAANALTTILYLLAVHKDVQKNEILRVLGDNLMLSVERQKELKYINMVINENLRLYPPNWEDPEKFIPERFENEKHDHYAWLSFGGVRKYEVSLPADSSIHKDKLRIFHRAQYYPFVCKSWQANLPASKIMSQGKSLLIKTNPIMVMSQGNSLLIKRWWL
ncbi:unnamed protein product [Rhizophagus irregularis]|nr:unnamed protein product [Rhizophagus irregularis]